MANDLETIVHVALLFPLHLPCHEDMVKVMMMMMMMMMMFRRRRRRRRIVPITKMTTTKKMMTTLIRFDPSLLARVTVPWWSRTVTSIPGGEDGTDRWAQSSWGVKLSNRFPAGPRHHH